MDSKHNEDTPAADVAPQGRPEYQITLTFTSRGMQRAFADWVASGEATRLLWQWMGGHGYHA